MPASVHETSAMGAAKAGSRNGGKDRNFVVALARGLEVLRAFKPTDGVLGNQEIAARTKLPKPTVSRLTYTLTRLGYLSHLPRLEKYQLAPAALALGYAALAHMGIRRVARPFMQELTDRTGGSVALGCRDRLSVIYIGHCRSDAAVTVGLDLGSRVPIAETAIGRALLVALPEAERRDIFTRLAARNGERWPKLKAGIERARRDIAARGFAISIGEWQPDVNGVGVPLALGDGAGTFAFNCGAPAFRISRERLEREIGPRLVEMVRKIEQMLRGDDLLSQTSPIIERAANGGGRGSAGSQYRAAARGRKSP